MTNDSSTLEGGNFDTTVETSETSYARHQYETSYADAEEHFSNIICYHHKIPKFERVTTLIISEFRWENIFENPKDSFDGFGRFCSTSEFGRFVGWYQRFKLKKHSL